MPKYDKIDIPEIVESLFNITSDSVCDCPEYAEDVEFITPDKTRLTCRFYPADRKSPTLLYFHDSMTPGEQYDAIAKHYIRQDMNFMLATYRGIGKNSGKPGFASLFEDAAFILQETVIFLQKEKFEGSLFVMGTSLGSACAIDIAYNCADLVKGIIIESGFCDTVPFFTGLGLDIIQKELSEKNRFYRIKVKTYFQNIVIFLIDQFSETITNTDSKYKQNYVDIERLKSVFVLIHGEYENKISLDRVAEKACMSPNYFCRFFKKVTGLTFTQYLLNIRE